MYEHQCNFHFDELLRKWQFLIERTNAWIDVIKTLLVHFEKIGVVYH